MAQKLDRCDVVDLLEEAVTIGRAVSVSLRDKQEFVDKVRDVITRDGEDWVVFATHPEVAVTDISFVEPARRA